MNTVLLVIPDKPAGIVLHTLLFIEKVYISLAINPFQMKQGANAFPDPALLEHRSSEETADWSRQLEAELADATLLQTLSMELIQEDGTAGLYNKLVEAAKTLMRSQFASMQVLFPDSNSIGKLRMLASSGFSPEAQKYWEWIFVHTGSSCSEVLRTGKRVIVENYATCGFMEGKPTLEVFLNGGVHAAQSTPLFSRNGTLLGMISTHWAYPHRPSEKHLKLLDVLARQAADLIERTQTAEALRQSAGRLRALMTATNDVTFKMNSDWTEMQQLDGHSFLTNTNHANSDWMEHYIPAEDRELMRSTIRQAIESKSIFQLEHRIIKVDGTIGWNFSRAIPIIDDADQVTEWFGAGSDITEKKVLLTQLEERVEERTKELQRSNEDLQHFAHVASHDLKEPVRKIRTFGLMLQDHLSEQATDRERLYLDKVLKSANRMSTMIEGVLEYSSFEGIEQSRQRLDLNTILDEIRNDLEVVIAEKQASIQYDAIEKFEGVPVLMYQLFYNLINNSLKFAKHGQKPVISITSRKVAAGADNFIEINVSDNGIGFEQEYSERIFESFARLNGKDKFDGTGLGLALVKKIVERHQGKIRATGELGVGATFILLLPAAHE
jgi:signal transduction histidine kinase